MGVELHVLLCVREEVFLRYAICVFYIYPRIPNTTAWQSTKYVIDMALLLHL